MIQAIDTHAHLDFGVFDSDRDDLITKLTRQGIGAINISSSLSSVEKSLALARNNRFIWSTVGIHPNEITTEIALMLPELLDSWSRRVKNQEKIVGLGEIGLDYSNREENGQVSLQKSVLRQFLNFASQEKLPVVFHCRDAYGDLTVLLKEYYPEISGVVHCFSGNQEELEQFLELGLSVSFTGMITYPKNDRLRELVKLLPDDRILLETDCPFLPVQNNRGQRNDPFSVLELARSYAALRATTTEDILALALENTQKLFKIKSDELD